MNDANVHAACQAQGMVTPCAGSNGCGYNDNICTVTSEDGCGNPMWRGSRARCGGNTYPSGCGPFDNTFAYMGRRWQGGSACGRVEGSWCATGNGYQNRFAYCARRR